MKFIIYSYPYDENSGGTVVLHRLCHIINEYTKHEAFLYPIDFNRTFRKKIRQFFNKDHYKFKVNPNWNTPQYTDFFIKNNSIVIYPEIVSGNPLNAKKVVRWFLHNPGHFTGEVNYGENELYFRYNSGFSYTITNNAKLSDKILNVRYTPTDIYFEDESIQKDIEVSYLVRKGKGKKALHSENSVCVDGLTHSETAEIFKRSKRFISYDPYTAYSHFAVLCGCESIVIPDDNVDIDKWYPNLSDRFGLAYGFDYSQIEWSLETKNDLVNKLINENLLSIDSVKSAIEEIFDYFN